MQLSDIRTCLRGIIVGGLIVGISACGGGGGGGSPNPVLGTLTFTTNENVALTAAVTATDPAGSAVTFTQTANPTSGTLTGFPGSGKFTYTPNANFTGNDSFGVTATDAAGNKSTGTVTIKVTVDQAPTASNFAVRTDDGKNINVLTNASDPDKDPLTVTITNGPFGGAATVNSDQTVNVSDVKGLITFEYTVTDPSGEKAKANAAVFVGVDPFRTAFVADASSSGTGSYEVFLTDFVSAPTQVSSATTGTLRLKGFAIADTGTTVVYRTQDTNNAATTSLSLVRTAAPATPVSISIGNGLTPALDGQGRDQFVVSPDGNWIALIAAAGNTSSLYVVNTTATTPVATPVVPSIAGTAATYATQPTFTSDSKSIYFLASSVASGANKTLYVVSVDSLAAPTVVSDISRPFTSDDISAYSVAPNQSTIVTQANRDGSVGLYSFDPANLGTKILINAAPAIGTAITSSTVGLPAGLGGSNTGKSVAYDVGVPVAAPESVGIYVAGVPPASTAAPMFVASGEQVIGFSPDDTKLLYTDGSQVFEAAAGAGGSGTQLGIGNQGWYDSGGNIVLLAKQLSSGGASLTSNTRPFGASNAVTATGTAAFDLDVSGIGSGVTIFGQAADNGNAPSTVNLQLNDVAASNDSNVAPVILKSLAASPLNLTTYVSKVVTK